MSAFETAIVVVEGIASLLLAIALVTLLLGARRLPATPRWLMVALLLVFVLVAVANFLSWSGLFVKAEFVQNILWPLVPVLWLFLFVVERQRTDRERATREYGRMKAVHALATQLAVALDPQKVMEGVVEAAARLLDAQLACICLPDEAKTNLVIHASYGIQADEIRGLRFERIEGTSIWRAFLEKRPFVLAHDGGHAMHPTNRKIVERYRIVSLVNAPLVLSGEAIGTVGVGRQAAHAFTDDDIALLETLVAYAAVAIHNARLYQRIVESEARHRALMEHAQVAIVVVDVSRHITFWNRGAERLFGWAAAEVLQRHVELIYPEEKRADVPREVLTHLDREGYWFGEYPAVRKDGSRFTCFLSLSRVTDPSRKALGTLGIVLDATEPARLREQVVQAQKMEAAGALAAGIAHDFNNLLTGILGFAGLMKSSLSPGGENFKAAAQIEEAAERGTQLVRRLLSFSHKQPVEVQPVRLNEVVTEAATFLRRVLPPTINLVTRLGPRLHIIQADATEMHQIIMNLGVNARDAMPRGGDLVLVTENLDLRPDEAARLGLETGPHVRLTVTDTGTGMDPDVLQHVFEPFFTTKPKGAGLGLSTAYAIVTRHRGRITCASEAGRGTTFQATFPVAPAKAAAGSA